MAKNCLIHLFGPCTCKEDEEQTSESPQAQEIQQQQAEGQQQAETRGYYHLWEPSLSEEPLVGQQEPIEEYPSYDTPQLWPMFEGYEPYADKEGNFLSSGVFRPPQYWMQNNMQDGYAAPGIIFRYKENKPTSIDAISGTLNWSWDSYEPFVYQGQGDNQYLDIYAGITGRKSVMRYTYQLGDVIDNFYDQNLIDIAHSNISVRQKIKNIYSDYQMEFYKYIESVLPIIDERKDNKDNLKESKVFLYCVKNISAKKSKLLFDDLYDQGSAYIDIYSYERFISGDYAPQKPTPINHAAHKDMYFAEKRSMLNPMFGISQAGENNLIWQDQIISIFKMKFQEILSIENNISFARNGVSLIGERESHIVYPRKPSELGAAHLNILFGAKTLSNQEGFIYSFIQYNDRIFMYKMNTLRRKPFVEDIYEGDGEYKKVDRSYFHSQILNLNIPEDKEGDLLDTGLFDCNMPMQYVYYKLDDVIYALTLHDPWRDSIPGFKPEDSNNPDWWYWPKRPARRPQVLPEDAPKAPLGLICAGSVKTENAYNYPDEPVPYQGQRFFMAESVTPNMTQIQKKNEDGDDITVQVETLSVISKKILCSTAGWDEGLDDSTYHQGRMDMVFNPVFPNGGKLCFHLRCRVEENQIPECSIHGKLIPLGRNAYKKGWQPFWVKTDIDAPESGSLNLSLNVNAPISRVLLSRWALTPQEMKFEEEV